VRNTRGDLTICWSATDIERCWEGSPEVSRGHSSCAQVQRRAAPVRSGKSRRSLAAYVAEVPYWYGDLRATSGAGSSDGARGANRMLDGTLHETKLAAADFLLLSWQEPPVAEPHGGWCGRTAGVIPPPTRSNKQSIDLADW